jgi:hypothetical protein
MHCVNLIAHTQHKIALVSEPESIVVRHIEVTLAQCYLHKFSCVARTFQTMGVVHGDNLLQTRHEAVLTRVGRAL